MDINSLDQSFGAYFNAKPELLVRAPGRVNLIGEHTDYNEGYVLPMAIDRAVWMAVRPRNDKRVRVHSLDLKTEATFDLQALVRQDGWQEYIKGIANELQKSGHDLHGFDAVMTGDVPAGAGLSSSAAVELVSARAFAATSGLSWDAARMARLAQKAENEWVGVNCGIMDQMASAASREGHALFLDCRSLEYENVPLPHGVSVVILDTSTRRGLVDSAYNERRTQCEQAAKWFGVMALRDVSVEQFNDRTNRENGLGDVVFRRARHVVTENARVLEAVQVMKAGDVEELGLLFNASHDSLRDDFEVTNDALNIIVECARAQDGCHGARMTGAGFGGCAVALVDERRAEAFVKAVSASYRQRSKLEASIYICKPTQGASLMDK